MHTRHVHSVRAPPAAAAARAPVPAAGHVFRAICEALPRAADAAPGPCYVRRAGPPGPLVPTASHLPSSPRRTVRAPVTDDEHPSSWRADPRRAPARRLRTRPGTSGSSRCRRASADGTRSSSRRPTSSARGSPERFGRLLRACAAAVLGPARSRIELVAPGARRRRRAHVGRARAPTRPDARAFNPRHTFDQFVIGDSNRLAHAAALAVAEMPGLAYNPLFICGPPGLGKTHLLHSIANYVTAYGGGATVRYTTAEAFTNHFVGALHGQRRRDASRPPTAASTCCSSTTSSSSRPRRARRRSSSTPSTRSTRPARRSSSPPTASRATSARSRPACASASRPASSPTSGAPDLATRLTILRKRVQQDGVGDVDPAALELIAERVTDNVRALEGALIRVVAFGSLTGRAVTAELAARGPRRPLPRAAQARPARMTVDGDPGAHGRGVRHLRRGARLRAAAPARVAWPRQVAMYLARELTDQTLPAIGRAFGGRNHTTVLHACKRTAERIAERPRRLRGRPPPHRVAAAPADAP